MGAFAGKKILISGGSKGIGRATAVEFARDGAHVCVAARKQDALDETVELMKAVATSGAVITSVSMDVSDPDKAAAGVASAIEALGGLDVLVCNQGFAHCGKVHEVPIDDFRRLLDVNYLGHVYVARAAAPHLIAQESGTIVLVSSVLGYLSTYGFSAYSGSKWAIVGFAEALRQEMGLHGVKVRLFYPGTTETPGLENENQDKPKVVWEMEGNSAFNVVRKPEDVALRLLKAVRGGLFENPVGWDGWLTFLASRHAPWLVRMFNDSDLRKAVKKHGDA
ncbi:MAG: 3-dehydrosphinganine reductase [Kiritimatiellia bacterium]|jgi:3-dehydrosphinganine reductase